MTIAIVSDTHNNRENAERALELIRGAGVSTVIHCGDISRPETIGLFGGFETHFCLGNADTDYGALREAAQALSPSCEVAPFFELEIDDVSIAACHGHNETLERLIETQRFAFVLHGHSHRRRDEGIGDTRVVNPGALGGLRAQSRSYCLLDLAAGTVSHLDL